MRPGTLLFTRLTACLSLVSLGFAQAPPGYYDTVDTTNATTLRSTLHEVIDDHLRFPYTAGSTDTWDILNLAQEDSSNSSNVIDIYRNRSFPKQGGGNSLYNREHSWPKSYGFPDDGPGNYPFTDCFQLFISDDGYNSARSNKPFRFCAVGHTEEPTDLNNGIGGGSGSYPGNSNWTSGSFTSGTWEVWNERKGDLARAMFYMDVRYEGGTHGVTGQSEPDLILTDNQSLIAASNTGSNESVAHMGMLAALLQWHQDDPVDAFELQKVETVFSFQGNRNPFVDHPEWVECIFESQCGIPPTTFCVAADSATFFCPCGNQGTLDTGCDNSASTGGVRCEATTFNPGGPQATLTCTGYPPMGAPTAIVIRSPDKEAFPYVVFGDGVRCVSSNSLVRLAAMAASGGTSVHTFGHGAMAGAGEFHYQTWYRNTGTFCTVDQFNLSSGVSLTWP